jgi:hypothetical protein
MYRDSFIDILACSVSATSFEHIAPPDFRGLVSAGCSCSETISFGGAQRVGGFRQLCSRSLLARKCVAVKAPLRAIEPGGVNGHPGNGAAAADRGPCRRPAATVYCDTREWIGYCALN